MRAVIQRVREASVQVDGATVGSIGEGLCVLLGVATDDTERDVEYLVGKIAHLRIFQDADGKMNRSLLEFGGEMLVISQFTLLADCRKGRRPSFVGAASPEKAEPLYRAFVDRSVQAGTRVATGRFGALMQVALINHGPVTLVLESR